MRRIIFVDDETQILDGLRRMLRKKRSEWEMEFYDGGEAALERMREWQPDVVVSDMRMPGMDGATLLTRIQEEHPETVRIVLSGYAELEAALRAIPVAHQFLTKPCEPTALCEVVERACALRSYLESDDLRGAVAGIDSLPSLPRVYQSLVAALADDDATIAEVVEIVEQDVAISAKVLQLVNSSFFGLARTVSGLDEAVNYLGLNTLKNVTLAIEVFREFEGLGASAEAEIFRLQEEATHCARLAAELVEGKVVSDNAFMAGLLHDIGLLVMITKMPTVHAEVSARCAAESRPRHEIEVEVGGVSHAAIGGFLLGIWGMPYPIVEAVAHHHHPSAVEPERFDLLGAVHVAQALIAEGSSGSFERGGLDIQYVESMNLAGNLDTWRGLAAEITGREQVAS